MLSGADPDVARAKQRPKGSDAQILKNKLSRPSEKSEIFCRPRFHNEDLNDGFESGYTAT